MEGGPGRPASLRQNVALAAVSLALALAASEIGLGAWLRTRATAETPPSILSEVLRLRASGEDAYPKIPGNVLVDWNTSLVEGERVWHPVAPAPGHATVVLCNENGSPVTYRADRHGFDNPDGVWEGPPPDVAVIGDSYTVGVCVDGNGSIPSRLRRTRTVLNLGASGAGPLQELALLREYARPRRPSVVLWIYYEGNDLWDLGREADRPWLTAYLDASHDQGLIEHHDAVDARYRAWIDSLVAAESVAAGAASNAQPPSLFSEALRLTALRRLAGIGAVVPRRAPPLGLLPQILHRARDDVAAWGGTLVLVYMPAYERYVTRVGQPVRGRRELLALAEASGIPVIDLHETFVGHGDPRSLWVSPRGHLSPAGYGLAAETIERVLASR